MWRWYSFLLNFRSMNKYPEIEKLKRIYLSQDISINKLEPIDEDWFVLVKMKIGGQSWEIYVDDEYGDFELNKPLVSFFLVLFSLEMYDDSLDYLEWCKQNLIDSSNSKWLDYYKSLEKTYAEIKSIFGEIDSCISSMDYQLRTGIIDTLIECEV